MSGRVFFMGGTFAITCFGKGSSGLRMETSTLSRLPFMLVM